MTTTTPKCPHTSSQVGPDYCFSGAIYGAEEDRRAHGGITYREECACGARREVNANGGWYEIGPWGPTRSEREAEARRLTLAASAAVASVPPLSRCDGEERTWLDAEGYIVSVPAISRGEASRLPAEWLASAQRARRAVVVAEAARRDA